MDIVVSNSEFVSVLSTDTYPIIFGCRLFDVSIVECCSVYIALVVALLSFRTSFRALCVGVPSHIIENANNFNSVLPY